ncbi:hypothetical protein [Bradyrhizobium cosmicum]|uniref:hypothetical protein n=1 Tax=Bradyrhizobium cosmicum TaxID=1404864 RepID=UPI0028EA7C00|nr:hypothetical protein [Bradyrhizobium cosmicum]
MPAFLLRKSVLAAMSGLALAVLVHPGAGFAYTQEEQQACTPDAMRLCGEFVPNVDAITACMIQKKSQLSPQCRAFFRPSPEPGMAAAPRAGKPTSIAPKSSAKAAKKSTKPAKKKKTEPS